MSPEAGEVTVRIRAIDEATPAIQHIAGELAELRPDPWPRLSAILGAVNLGLLVGLLTVLLGR